MRPLDGPDKLITNQIDLAAAIAAATNQSPTVFPGRRLMQFAFPMSDEVLHAAATFAAGTLMVSAANLLKCRSSLYRRMREVGEVGGAR